ncbi:MAG: YihY/virulence factor BrkB family protein [Anaerolineae bacterium]
MRPLSFAHFIAAYKAFVADHCSRMAAAMSFYALLSIFPMLLLVISAASYALTNGWFSGVDAEQYVLGLVNQVFPASSNFVANSLRVAQARRDSVGLLGLLALWWSASGFFVQVDAAIDTIWKTEARRAGWLKRLLAFGVVLAMTGLLLVLMFANALLEVIRGLVLATSGEFGLIPLVQTLGSIIFTSLIFTLLFRIVPNRPVRWRDAWPGAVVGALLWEALRQILIWYITDLADYSAVYGPVGSVIALLIWIYIGGQVFLFAAELAAVSSLRRDH